VEEDIRASRTREVPTGRRTSAANTAAAQQFLGGGDGRRLAKENHVELQSVIIGVKSDIGKQVALRLFRGFKGGRWDWEVMPNNNGILLVDRGPAFHRPGNRMEINVVDVVQTRLLILFEFAQIDIEIGKISLCGLAVRKGGEGMADANTQFGSRLAWWKIAGGD
jgi:hypothetical protein